MSLKRLATCALLFALLVLFEGRPFHVFAADTNGQALRGMNYTAYHPIDSDTKNKTVEGGPDASRGRIVTAVDVLQSRRLNSNTIYGTLEKPVTLAGDPSHKGEIYFIPNYTFQTIDQTTGKVVQHTLPNFYGRVDDTGGAFKGRPTKIDIATDHISADIFPDPTEGQKFADREDNLSSNRGTIDLVPYNDPAKQFAASQGTRATTIVTAQHGTGTTAPKQTTTIQQAQRPVIPQRTPQMTFGQTMWASYPPFCYKHMGPASRGFVSMALTCNSGYRVDYTPAGPVAVPLVDCGKGSILCTVPQGCLNQTCAASANAIWDPITHKCGCG